MNWRTRLCQTKRFFPDKKETYSGFIKKYGQQNRVYFGFHSQSGFDIYAFFNKGMAIVANPQSDIILEVWYFEINNQEVLININQEEISEEPKKIF